jgi:hypothetical protein
MKKHTIFGLVLLATAVTVFAQTRDDIKIYIAPVVAQDPAQARYFQENFAIETVGAGYVLAENANQADYTLNLEVKPHMIQYDDGTQERATEEDMLYLLEIHLLRNQDRKEIVSFDYAFNTLEEMYEYNLYLLYQTMANVPLTKLGGAAEVTDHWRNKWLYIRASFDYPITFYQLMEPYEIWGDHPNPSSPGEVQKAGLDHKISPFPAATFGFEFQYLNWMSTEFNFNLSFSDPMSNSFIPAIQIEQKFPIKPSMHFMIEPYAAVAFPVNTSSKSKHFPMLGVGGGCQVGVRGGEMGAFFVDANFIYFLGDVVMLNESQDFPHPEFITYKRFVVGLGIGYKVGFLNRNK